MAEEETTRLFWVWVPISGEDSPLAIHAATPESAAREFEHEVRLPFEVHVFDPKTCKRWRFRPEHKVTFVLMSEPPATDTGPTKPSVMVVDHPGQFEP